MKRLLDPTFQYVASHSTDIRKTFAKERKRLEAERKQQQDAQVVVPISKRAEK